MTAKQVLLLTRKTTLYAFLLLSCAVCNGQQELDVFDKNLFDEPFAGDAQIEDFREGVSESASFDNWQPIFEETSEEPCLLPFDYVRHFGFRHSSTHGRHVGRGIPLEGTSWKNRPYHVDWFLGSFLGDELIHGRVSQDNELIAGLRLGWDIDYFWGLECRFGWSDPNIQLAGVETTPINGSIFLSDIDLVYYPWGDSKIRPYGLIGTGFVRYDFVDDMAVSRNTTLVSIPVGGGIQFHHWSWLAWRLEILDNIALGSDGLNTQHSVSLTAGMELRLGARPQSYWPWRSSRRIW